MRVSDRVAWFLLVFGVLGVFSYILVLRVSYFLEYPPAVNVEILYAKSLPFPTVTVCNQNFLR